MSRSLSSECAPCLRFACLLSSVRSTVHDRSNDTRKAVNEMWSAFTGIFATVPPLISQNNSGGKYNKKVEILRNCLPPGAVIARPALVKFIKLLKNVNFLQVKPLENFINCADCLIFTPRQEGYCNHNVRRLSVVVCLLTFSLTQ